MESTYKDHQSAYKVAEIYGVNHKTVYALMEHYGIKQEIGSQGARKVNLNHDYFEVIDTPEKAYWLGFIMADGCIYKGADKYSLRLQINLKSSDIEHLEKFQRAINSSYKIQVKKVGNSETCILKINSTKFCKDLIKHGVTERKSIVCQYPKIPEELNIHFIRGYFDGDGCICIGKNPTFSIVGTYEFLIEVQDVLIKECGLNKTKFGKRREETDIFTLLYCGRNNVKKIRDWMYLDARMYIERKFDKFYLI